VTKQSNLANPVARLIALFIDTVIVNLIPAIITLGAHRQTGLVLGFIIGAAYQWYFLTQHRGQTPGKMLLGIRVRKTNRRKLTGADAVVRYFGYYVNTFFFLLGWIWALFDDNHQGWHDKLAGTVVVQA
jgi:uncharacterized RDD family membrane protein YckC